MTNKLSDYSRRFDETLRRIVQVPKAEVDMEESKYRAMRKRLKDKEAQRKPKR